ncbi:hypothetical protein ACOMHN_009761 [Nucella lapillus]
MDGFHFSFLVYLQLIMCPAILEGSYIPLHCQNVYPGCKTSQDKSDIPKCNRTKFLQEMAEHQPEFREHAINTSDLFTCFTESGANITLNSTLKGYINFNGVIPSRKNGSFQRDFCHCKLFARSPPETFFEINNSHFTSDQTVYIAIYNGSEMTHVEKYASTRTNVLSMDITVLMGKNQSIAISFQAVPPCERHLRVICTSTTDGLIETFGWSERTPFMAPVDSCVTLHVPPNHATMISLVSTNIRYPFRLFVYETANCSVNTPKLITTEYSEFPPTLLNDTLLVSFRFSSGDIRELGFRLLFSFHSRLQEPRQFPDGKWDCGAAHYRSFRQHFVCHSQTYCSDARVQEMCGDAEVCGVNVMRLGATCYQTFEPADKTSWTEAADICSTLGGGLAAAPKDASTMKEIRTFTAFRKVQVFCGFRFASEVTSHEMLQISHKFLECDVSTNCNAANQEESITCSRGKTPPVPFFTCQSHGERVPYTLVCDFKQDCCDGSDEDFCTFSACTGKNVFQCANRKQRSHCVDGSDEYACSVDYKPMSSNLQPLTGGALPVVEYLGNGYLTVQHNTSCPETHYLCPGEYYCMPVYTRCNRMYDCPGKEDEEDCHRYTCPGFYRCRNSHICLAPAYMCDGHFQCPERDDELFCSIPCPVSCTCYGFAFICSNPSTVSFSSELRYLEITYGDVHPSNLKNNVNLVYLSLKNCGIKELGQLNFPNLLSLDLSHNVILTMSTATFAMLKNLASLSLGHNPLLSNDPFFHADSEVFSIRILDLSGITILEWYDSFLTIFPNLQHLNMSECELTTMTEKGFQTLSSLRSLDLGGCPMETFYPGVFKNLQQLKYINTDNDKLCCPGVMPSGMGAENCKAPTDEISSCDALLRTDVFRFFLALYASLSLIGNLGSFVYRVVVEKSSGRIGFEVFVTHLSVADMLMGVYLAIIGVADRLYSRDYRWKDAEWKQSAACQLAGFLSLLSSELSAFLICLITLERFLVIRFPHKQLRFSPRMAHAASLAGWLVGVVLAAIPLLPVTAHWRFYSQTGICIPLPITRARFPGKDYSFAVMIVMNFLLFLFIAVGQVLIYWSIRSHTITCVDAGRKAREKRVARRLLAVVMTDFLCWFPIGLLGMLARYGVPIPGQVNVAIAIFVLPFNSALNPFLYTLNIILERRQNASQAQKYREEKEKTTTQNTIEEARPESETNNEEMSYSKEEAFRLFKEFVEDGLLTHEQGGRRLVNVDTETMTSPFVWSVAARLLYVMAVFFIVDVYCKDAAQWKATELGKRGSEKVRVGTVSPEDPSLTKHPHTVSPETPSLSKHPHTVSPETPSLSKHPHTVSPEDPSLPKHPHTVSSETPSLSKHPHTAAQQTDHRATVQQSAVSPSEGADPLQLEVKVQVELQVSRQKNAMRKMVDKEPSALKNNTKRQKENDN